MKAIRVLLISGLALASYTGLRAQVAGSMGDKLLLPGATKDALKHAPEFEYAR
jgi:hypothetical protein